jgi:hypothetical protein
LPPNFGPIFTNPAKEKGIVKQKVYLKEIDEKEEQRQGQVGQANRNVSENAKKFDPKAEKQTAARRFRQKRRSSSRAATITRAKKRGGAQQRRDQNNDNGGTRERQGPQNTLLQEHHSTISTDSKAHNPLSKQTDSKAVDSVLIRRLYYFFEPYKWWALLAIVLTLSAAFLGTIRPKLTQIAVDDYIAMGD